MSTTFDEYKVQYSYLVYILDGSDDIDIDYLMTLTLLHQMTPADHDVSQTHLFETRTEEDRKTRIRTDNVRGVKILKLVSHTLLLAIDR